MCVPPTLAAAVAAIIERKSIDLKNDSLGKQMSTSKFKLLLLKNSNSNELDWSISFGFASSNELRFQSLLNCHTLCI